MRGAVLAASCLALAAPSAVMAQDSVYDRAVALRQSDAAGAVVLLERWLVDHPADADARVQLGFALLTLSRLDEAEREFAAVLAEAPGYSDARQGLRLVRERRDGDAETRPGFVVIDGAVSNLGEGQSDWHEAGVLAALPLGTGDTLEAEGRWFERFGLEDVELAARYTHRAGSDLWLRAGLSATPSADFRPEIGLSAGIDYRLAPATVASLDTSWQRFPLQEVVTLRPSLTQYFDEGRFALTAGARAVFVDDETLVGGSARADWLPRERTRVFVGAANGPETDLGVVSDTTSLYGGGELPLTGTLSLLGSVSREWRGLGADRTEARLGIRIGL